MTFVDVICTSTEASLVEATRAKEFQISDNATPHRYCETDMLCMKIFKIFYILCVSPAGDDTIPH